MNRKELDKDHQTIINFIYEDVRDRWPDFNVSDNFTVIEYESKIRVKFHATTEIKNDTELHDSLLKIQGFLDKRSTTLSVIEKELKKSLDLREKYKEH